MFNFCMKSQRKKREGWICPYSGKKRTSGLKSVNPKECDNMEYHAKVHNILRVVYETKI